jgi:magnesium-transporting ATPase (P-type)
MNGQFEQIIFQRPIDQKVHEGLKVTGYNELLRPHKHSFFQILLDVLRGSMLLMLIIFGLVNFPEEYLVLLTISLVLVLTMLVLRGVVQFIPLQRREMALCKVIYLVNG